ncbi:pleckstrin homology domain-containing family A member 8-like [Mercenaria mercenaria]|uniref:pleckstrin homology domain-containing family A member 8-like n=1 Tax=Mercenaria mercenaria TaxID=6596 RepID=UPI00234F34FC|nr:pleckstrin homology domain-containing family A member 8-like [Mercenaria mercenaria]
MPSETHSTIHYLFVDVSRKMYMAGTLWKWTNYFSGWQERWFVLDNGILSYYKSQDDVNSGCKGSVKMSVCDISVHTSDNTRLDLIIPGEQHFYVKAPNAQERQEWLVALGSSKASKGKLNEDPELVTQDLLKTKRSELRLYCDLLVQQIHSVKMAATQKDGPDIEKLDQATSLISPTCDTFIRTMEECMQLIQSSLPYEGTRSPNTPITDAALPPSPLKLPNKKNRHFHRQNSSDRTSVHSHSRSPSTSSVDATPPTRQNSRNRTESDASLSDVTAKDHTLVENIPNSALNSQNAGRTLSHGLDREGIVQSNSTGFIPSIHKLHNISEIGAMNPGENLNNSAVTSHTGLKIELTGSVSRRNNSETGYHSNDEVSSEGDVFLDPVEPRVPTFFTVMGTSFMDLKIADDAGIPVEPFLDSCKNMLPIFDKLNSTAFAPVKMDFQGNIRKVRTKYSVHPEEFTTLQSIIHHEISKKQQHLASSATMALLWMKRSLEFIAGFLAEIKKGEENLGVAASNAYAASLKPFHGWVVRGVFAVAVKALPYRSTFLSLLNPNEGDVDEQAYISSLMTDIDAFCCASDVVVKILDDFFTANNINIDEQI